MAVPGQSAEAAKPAAGDVLEKDTLDRILGAEHQDLVELRLPEFCGHRKTLDPTSELPQVKAIGFARADSRSRRARRLRGGLPAAGGSAPCPVHRRDVSRQSRSAQ